MDDDAKARGRRFTTITAEQIRSAAAFANFGDSDPARVVCRGMLQIAGGFCTGGMVRGILTHFKLLGPRSGQPTKLGRLFLYDLYANADPLDGLKESA